MYSKQSQVLHEHSRTPPTGQPAAASSAVEGAVSWSAPGGAIGSIGDWEDWEGGAIVSRVLGKTLWISLGMRMTKYQIALPCHSSGGTICGQASRQPSGVAE